MEEIRFVKPEKKDTKEKLETALDSYIENQAKNEWHEPKIGVYHASQVWGCLRKQYLSFKQPKEFPAIAKRRCFVGTWIHELMQDKVLKDEIISKEVKVSIPLAKDVQIVGKYDAMGEDKDGKYLIDFKSTGWLKDEKNEASDHHIQQLNLYMYATGVHRGFIHEIQKDDLFNKVFEIKFDPKLFEFTASRVILLDKFLRCNEIPEMDSQAYWECGSGCPYLEECTKLESEKSGNKGNNNKE